MPFSSCYYFSLLAQLLIIEIWKIFYANFFSLNCCFINCNHAIDLQLYFNKQLNSNWAIQRQSCALEKCLSLRVYIYLYIPLRIYNEKPISRVLKRVKLAGVSQYPAWVLYMVLTFLFVYLFLHTITGNVIRLRRGKSNISSGNKLKYSFS